ncbi:MAG: AAA family ATPase [Planctomycetaceae bacterium]
MQILVASNNPSTAASIQHVLLKQGHVCTGAHVVRLEDAVNYAAQIRPDAIIVTLSPDPVAALETLGELRETTRARVLGVGPASDAKLILESMRKGAYQYLDETVIDGELTAAINRLATNDNGPAEPGKIIAVLGPSGGSGSSTVAVNVATVLAQHHAECALFDLKLENGDLATLLDLKPDHTIAEFCDNLARMDDNMFGQCFVRHATGVHLMAAPHMYADAARVTAQGVRKALGMARRRYSYVVIDLDHSYRQVHAQAMYQADVIVIVVRLELASLRQAQRTLDYMNHLGIAEDRVRLIANRCGWQNELRVSQVQKTLGIKVLQTIPDDPKSLRRANLKGMPVVRARPLAKVSRSLINVAMSVNGQVGTVN